MYVGNMENDLWGLGKVMIDLDFDGKFTYFCNKISETYNIQL